MNNAIAETTLGGTLLFTALGVAAIYKKKQPMKKRAEVVAAFAGVGAIMGLAIGGVAKALS